MAKGKYPTGLEIMQMGKIISEKFPEFSHFDHVEIDIAMEDLVTASENLQQIVKDMKSLKQGDYENFSQLLSDLLGLFQHTESHIQQVNPILEELFKAVCDKLDSKSSK